MSDETPDSSLLELATDLTMAWLANPNTRASAEEVPAFLQSMHGAVTGLAAGQAPVEQPAPAAEFVPAVSARRSLASKEHIISLIDGKPYKTLKRHLSGNGLTPAEYRARYGLKSDYPMVAESYAEMRRDLARKIGLGRKPGVTVATARATAKPAVVKPAAKPAAKKPATPAVGKSAAESEAKAAPAKTARWARPTTSDEKPQS